MERRAEINRFAIFLFCLLVPLGSLAPTETSESKMTTGKRQKRFTTDIKNMAAAIHGEASNLFAFYNNCVSAAFPPVPSKIRSKGRDMAETIVECPAFHADCCVLHHIHNILKTLKNYTETICNGSSTVITANLEQLEMTLSQGEVFSTCKVPDPPRAQTLGWGERKTYIWWVLKKYKDITQTAATLSPKPAVWYARMKK